VSLSELMFGQGCLRWNRTDYNSEILRLIKI